MPKSFVGSIPPPPNHKFCPEDPMEDEDVPLGRLIEDSTRSMFALLSNMKTKWMVGIVFVMFVPTAISHNGGS